MVSELNHVIDILPVMMWTALTDGQVDFANQHWCEFTGFGLDETRGHGWQAAVHHEDRPELLRQWESLLAGGKPGAMEARLRRWNGEFRHFTVKVSPLRDLHGNVLKWYGVNTDVEDCRRAEQSARTREAELRSIVDSMPAFVALTEPSGSVDYFNRSGLAYFGSRLDELTGSEAADTIHPQDRPSVMAAWRQAVATGQAYEIQHRLRRSDGVYRWFDVRGQPLRDSEGRITRWLVVDVDIDEQKKDKALLAGESRLLEMVARGRSRPDILEALCRLVEEIIDGCRCSVMLAKPGGNRLELGAAPSLAATFIDSVVDRPVHVDAGPCQMAACLTEQVIASDLAVETRWATSGWCKLAMAHGLRACWSTPFTADAGEVLGVIAIYDEQAKSPSPRELALMDQLTHIASIAVERQRSQTNLARALDEVRASEDRLRTIIDAIPGFVWSAGPDGSVDFLNQRWCEYTGMRMEESFGTCWNLTIHPDDRERVFSCWQLLLRSGESGEIEARMRRHDGVFRWFLLRMVPLRDATGRPVKWFGQNTDIEERKQAELLLAGENRVLGRIAGGLPLTRTLVAVCELAEGMFSGSHCSIVLVDPRRIRRLDDAAPLLRLRTGAAPTLPGVLLEGVDGRLVDEASDPVCAVVLANEPVLLPDISEETRWDHWRSAALSNGLRANWSFPITSTNGVVLGAFSMLFRQTQSPSTGQQKLIAQFAQLTTIAIERARGEAALKQSEAFLGKAQQLSQTGTFSWRVATDEITWSEEIYRIYEMDPTITPTHGLIDLRLHPDDLQSHRQTIERQRNHGCDFEHEHRLLMPDGAVKYLHLVAHAACDENGDLEYIAAVQDVTQRRHSEEVLDRVRSELSHVARVATVSALTASIAHEVNQPLAGIITNANTCLRMLAADPPNVDGARETARRTIRDGNRASDVIQRLRALFSKKEFTTDPVDLNDAAREVIAILFGELQRNGVTVLAEFADNLLPVQGDRVQLQQVIRNLLANAAEAVRETGGRPRQILIRTAGDESDHALLTVKDNGVGFDPLDVGRLFDSFYTTKSDGMGIGLSISRSIIEKHNGRLWAELNSGPGATFAFSVPFMSDLHDGERSESCVKPDVPDGSTQAAETT